MDRDEQWNPSPVVLPPEPVVVRVGAGIATVVALGREAAGLLPRALRLVAQAEQLLNRVDVLLTRIELTRLEASQAVADVGLTRAATDRVVDSAAGSAERVGALLDTLQPALTRLAPVLDRLGTLASTRTADQAVDLLDQLRSVSPDLRELLDASLELNELLGHLPGMKRIRRKVEQEGQDAGTGTAHP